MELDNNISVEEPLSEASEPGSTKATGGHGSTEIAANPRAPMLDPTKSDESGLLAELLGVSACRLIAMGTSKQLIRDLVPADSGASQTAAMNSAGSHQIYTCTVDRPCNVLMTREGKQQLGGRHPIVCRA